MTTRTAGRAGTAAPAASPPPLPLHYLRRLARRIVLRAAVRGRLSWHVALPLLASIDGGA